MLILDVQLSKNMKLMWEDVTLKSLFSHILIIKVAKTSLFGFMMLITNTNTCTRGQFHSPILCFHKLPNQTIFHNVGTRQLRVCLSFYINTKHNPGSFHYFQYLVLKLTNPVSTYGIDLKTTDKGQHIPTKEHKTQAILTSQNWKYDEEISCLVNTFIAAPDTALSTAATLCVPKHSHHTHKHSYSLARQPVGQPFLEPQNSQLSLSDSWLAPCSCWLFSSLYGSCPFPEPLVPWPASRRALLR